MDFDLCVRKCRVCNYNLLFAEWFVSAFSSTYSLSGCNKYLNLTQHGHIQSAHFVRYRYVKGEFATDGEFSETRLKLGTKCRANLFLRGVSVDEKSILDTKSGMSDIFRITITSTFVISMRLF